MQKSPLISLLQTLVPKEMRDLESFLLSPFFNRRPEVTRLYAYLSACLTQYGVIPGKEEAYQAVAGKQTPYDDQQMRLWMSYLLKLTEQFLVHRAFLQDPVEVRLKLIEQYRERGLNKQQEKHLRDLHAFMKKAPYRNAAYYAHDFSLQLEEYRFLSTHRRMSELNIQLLSDDLDIAYISQKLRHACLAIAHQNIYNTEYSFGLIQELLAYAERESLLNTPAISVYYYGYRTLTEPEKVEHFAAFKQLVLEVGRQFPTEERGDLFILAINFCIKRYNEGDSSFIKDEFELYQKGLEQGLFLKNKTLSRFTYRNIITVGLVTGAFEWVEQFIHDYKPALDKEYRESMFSFSLARLEYSRKNYQAALRLLQKSEYKDLLLNLAAKTVMLKIFYELDEFDLLSAHLDAMRTFIRRKKVIGYHQTNYLNLIQFTRKLIERNLYDKEQAKQLQTEIEQTKAVAEKGWLLEQCAL